MVINDSAKVRIFFDPCKKLVQKQPILTPIFRPVFAEKRSGRGTSQRMSRCRAGAFFMTSSAKVCHMRQQLESYFLLLTSYFLVVSKMQVYV